MIPSPDIGFVYPKTGLDVDLRFEDRPHFTSSGSMYLDGTNDRLDCDGAEWASQAAWTIACWIKCSGTSTTAQIIMSAIDGSNTFDLYASGGASANVHLNDGNSGQNIASNALLFDGAWHHLALTCGAGGGATATLYFDGQIQGTITCTCDDLSSATTLHIGANTAGASTLAGNLAHFGIWESALSQASIRKLMLATTYAEVISESGATPKEFWLLEADGTASIGQDGTLTNGAAIVGDRAHLPNGYDLTGNQLNAVPFSGRAWVGDGTGDYCEAPASTDTVMTGGTFSTSFWCKTSDASEQTAMAMIGTYGWQIALLGGSDPALWKFQVLDDSGWETVYASEADSNMPSKFDDGKWRFIVATATAGTMRLYVNGAVDADTDTINTGVSYPNAATVLHIGSDKNDAANWQGSLADLKIWNIALSQAQIDELFANREQILPTGASSTNLKAWYPLNDYDVSGADSLNGLYMSDASQYNNPAKSINGIMEFSQSGIPQLGLRSSSSRILYDEVDDVVTVGDNAAIDGLFGAGGSIAVWIMPFSDGEGTYGRIVETGSGGYFFLCSSESGSACKVYFSQHWDGDDGTWITNATDLAYGEWNHVVITYDGSSTSNDPIIYVNSSVKAITESGSPPSGTVNADANDKRFGNSSGGDRTFDGIISEVAMYKGTILDADAVTVMYNGGVQGFDLLTDSSNYDNSGDLDGWWKLDNPVTIEDLSTNSNNGTVAGTPNMATVPEGDTAGLSVFGTLTTTRLSSGVLTLPPVGSTTGALGGMAEMRQPAFGTQNFTIACWVRCDAYLSGYPYLYNFAAGSNEYGVKAFVVNASGAIQWTYEGATTSQTGSGTAGGVGKWTFTVFQRLGAASFKLKARLIDSASWAFTTSKTVDVGDMTEAGPGYWGNYGASNSLCGPLAFPRVYLHGSDAAWTEDELDAIFEQGKRFLLGDS